MAKEFDATVKEITDIRAQKRQISINTYLEQQTLIRNQYLLQAAINQNQSGGEYVQNIDASRVKIGNFNRDFAIARDNETQLIATLQESFGGFDNLVNQMNDRYPILFFPVRIETVFMDQNGFELWVRIFPDDIAVETHEEDLTQSEIDEGMLYWRSFADATSDAERVQAWDLLCRSFGAERAAWVALQMQPTNLPAPPAPPPPSDQLIFPVLTPKNDAWSKQPVTRIMPDAFVIYAYDTLGGLITQQTNNVPDELKMGIDPTLDPDTQSMSFDQQNVSGRMNELVANPDVDWMINFDAAIASGLGAKIPLNAQQFNGGFQKILVLGVKATLTVEESQTRLENLINSHHYTDGFSLLKQGTSTNNSDTDYSGYSFVEFGNPTTFQTERKDPLFTPVFTQRQKTDGQLLCEALGIEYDVLYHIFESNGMDISNSMTINNLLYQVSFGYTANELMPIFGGRRSNNNELRQFFSDYIRSRGALPSIRSGTQPYGILPASVYSRINWDTDPNAGLYRRIFDYTQALDVHWSHAVAAFDQAGLAQGRAASPPSGSPAQRLSDMLTAHAVSTSYVQRVGVGAGYVWNNLQYAALEYQELSDQWNQQQMERMNQVVNELQLPLDFSHKAVQMNYLEEQSSIEIPLVASKYIPQDGPLPEMSKSGNMLMLLHDASFDALRDEDYNQYGVPDEITEKDLKRNMLYRFTRQSLMLEYYEAACDLLKIPDDQRGESEFVNIVDPVSPPGGQEMNLQSSPPEGGPMGRLTYGTSRLQLMATPFEGFRSVGEFLSSDKAQGRPEAFNLIEAKTSLRRISNTSIRDLNLLTAELVDTVSYRLDTWRLSLVNQRLNALRGITEGSDSRYKGLYLGAYGWVTDIKRNSELTPVAPPSPQFEPGIFSDSRNKGYIHAPSINQAVAGAVMLSGYKGRADSNMADPLSINLSSDRVRASLDIMDGIRNGQDLSVLLGYEFERRFRDLYANPDVNLMISRLRDNYPIESFITEVTPDPGVVEKVKARNVVSGAKLVEVFKTSGISTILAAIAPVPSPAVGPITDSVNWIWNLMDAVGDIAMSEGLFHVVQGNPVKGGALADAISKGNLMAEPDVLDSIKSGLEVGQRFTMHFKAQDAPVNGWAAIGTSYRRLAEPYVNTWLSELLPDPSKLMCTVIVDGDDQNPKTVLASSLGLQPIDLMYLVNEELANDDSILSLIIKKYVRENSGTPGYTRDNVLEIVYGPEVDDDYFSFDDVLPVLLYARKVVTASRPLNTKDYMLPGDAGDALPIYNLTELQGRLNTARSELNTAITALNNALSPTFSLSDTIAALYTMSKFGMEQTVYEFVHDTAQEDEDTVKAWGASVLALAQTRYSTSVPIAMPGVGDDPVPYVNSVVDCLKTVFGQSFAPMPLFEIRAAEQAYLSLMVNLSSTLKNDHSGNDLLVHEWLGSVARVRKNAANYEMLSILASAVDFRSFHSLRHLLPMQLPYASDGLERWLGASVTTDGALKEGRIAIGASLPAGYLVSGDQVGILVDDWIDVIPAREQTSGVSFHHNQPNAKAPQCLLLGLTPQITGNWRWDDLVDMLNETLDLAKKRAVDYEQISSSVVGQLPAFTMPFAQSGNLIGLSGSHILSVNP